MIQRVDQLKEPPVVGRYYIVPCVYRAITRSYMWWDQSTKCDWVPIIGHEHSDPEAGAEFSHFHFDFRFLSSRLIREFGAALFDSAIDARTVRARGNLKLKCKRKMPAWPGGLRTPGIVAFRQDVARACKGRKMCNRICPHRGFSLSSIAPDENGVIECPGHGLQFRVDTGEMLTEAAR